MEQLNIFGEMFPEFEITKPIRLIELFAGYGSQAMALERLGADFEHYKVVEFDKFAINSYNAVHGTDFKVTDIRDIHAEDIAKMESVNSNSQLYKQFGNSIVVDVLCAIFKQLNIKQEKEKDD